MDEAVPVHVLLPSGQVAYEASLLPGTSVEELLMKIAQAGDFAPWLRLSLVLGSQKLSSATTLGSLKLNAQDVFYLVQQPPEPEVKVLLLGGMMAGKTALSSTFSSGEFVGNYNCTIGVDFASSTMLTAGATRARVKVWDTQGHERFHSLITSCLRGKGHYYLEDSLAWVKHQEWGCCSLCMNYYTL